MTDLPYRIIYAVLTMDAVFIYDTQQTYPIAMLRELHYADLTDCAWSPDGTCLFLSSLDGYCSILQLDTDDLGTPLSKKGKMF